MHTLQPNQQKMDEAKALFMKVKHLSEQGFSQQKIAEKLGIKTTFTLNSRLVKASQITGDAIPPFRTKRINPKDRNAPIEEVQVTRRGRGETYGASIPQEPLKRAGIQLGDVLKLRVRGKSILLMKQ